MTNTNEELTRMCQDIREELNALYEADYTDEEREEKEESGEAYDLYSYFSDPLDYEYTISSRGDFLGVKVWLTLGGPNIWIDTRTGYVEGRWGSDSACAWVASEICEEINSMFEELYNCM